LITRRLANDEFAFYGRRVAEYEREVTYPLGADRFSIDHGADYFSFFRRLRGRPECADDLRYYVVEDGGRLRGVLAAVRRVFPSASGPRASWYVCDLKAIQNARGVMSPLLRCSRDDAFVAEPSAYAISMNRQDGSNPLVDIAQRFAGTWRFETRRLVVFSLDFAAVARARSVLADRFGAISFLSLRGVKDIVLASSGEAMPLYHLQHGPLAERGRPDAAPNAMHMFCLCETDRAVPSLAALDIAPTASATVLVVGESGPDPALFLTSDI
jgi:hypothetical protein